MYRHLLVPTDGSKMSNEMIASAVGLARALDARVTFLHVQRDYAASLFDDGALMRSLSPDIFSEMASGDARAILAKAETFAVEAKITFESVIKVGNRPYEKILETAEERGCDLIFMASHGRKGAQKIMRGSQARKVFAHAKVTVLFAPSRSSSSTPMMDKAIAFMDDEHRSLAVVIHGIRHVLQAAGKEGRPPDFDLLRSMVYYIENFPQRLHHPKEERYLFPRLLGKTEELDKIIAELSHQHREDPLQLEGLKQALAKYEADPQRGPEESSEALEKYMDFERLHMLTEDRYVLPAARRYLTEADWTEIAKAFGKNGDPSFSTDIVSAFRTLFARIMNLATQAGKNDPA